MEISNKDLGWLVAIINGEGSLHMGRQLRTNCKDYNYSANLYVANTNCIIIETLYKITKLGVIRQRVINHIDYKDQKEWKLHYNDMRILLPIIEPKLIIKRRQAQLLIEFLNLEAKIGGDRAIPIPISTSIERELIFEELKDLNKKGIKMISSKSR